MIAFLKSPNFFPVVLCTLYLASCARFVFARDWGRALYWLCALGINVAASFLIGRK